MTLQFGYRCSLIAVVITLMKSCLLRIDLISGLQMTLVNMLVYFVLGTGIGWLARQLVLESVEREMTIKTSTMSLDTTLPTPSA